MKVKILLDCLINQVFRLTVEKLKKLDFQKVILGCFDRTFPQSNDRNRAKISYPFTIIWREQLLT